MLMPEINYISKGKCFGPKQVHLPDKSRAIKGLVVCNGFDLKSFDPGTEV